MCTVEPVLQDPDASLADELEATFFVDREDYDLLSVKADKYVLEEFFDRKHTFTIEQEVDFEFDDY